MENKALVFKSDNIKVTLGDKEYRLVFDLNAFCELESIYGSVDTVLQMILGDGKTPDTTVKYDGVITDANKITIGDTPLSELLPKLTSAAPRAKLKDSVNILYAALMHDCAKYDSNDEVCGYTITKARIGSYITPQELPEINAKLVMALMRDLVPAKAEAKGKNAETSEATE